MPTYTYTVKGTDRDNLTWETEGEVVIDSPGFFPLAVQQALRESFEILTQGKARYGDTRTCHGPYKMQEMTVRVKS